MIKRDAKGRILEGSEGLNQNIGPKNDWPIRYWARVDKNGPAPAHQPELGPCWIWNGTKTSDGYGEMWANMKRTLASHAAFFLEHGRWPVLLMLHKCDNPPCVNPNHLFEGTRGDNIRDAAKKGRLHFRHPWVAGENNCNAKITRDIAFQIRHERQTCGTSSRALGRKHGLNKSTILAIVNNKAWVEP